MTDPTVTLPDTAQAAQNGPLDAIPAVPLVLPAHALPWFLTPSGGDRSAILAASIDTPGIARKMDAGDLPNPAQLQAGQPAAQQAAGSPAVADAAPPASGLGGGDLNGTAALILLAQAGTSGRRIAVPRAMAGNYTGVV